jgi:hypothetical protein
MPTRPRRRLACPPGLAQESSSEPPSGPRSSGDGSAERLLLRRDVELSRQTGVTVDLDRLEFSAGQLLGRGTRLRQLHFEFERPPGKAEQRRHLPVRDCARRPGRPELARHGRAPRGDDLLPLPPREIEARSERASGQGVRAGSRAPAGHTARDSRGAPRGDRSASSEYCAEVDPVGPSTLGSRSARPQSSSGVPLIYLS